MKTIEQIALEVAQEMGLIANSVYEAFAKQFLDAWLAQQEPVAWAAWDMQEERYRITTNKKSLPAGDPLYLAPPPAVQQKPAGYALIINGARQGLYAFKQDAMEKGMEIGARFDLLPMYYNLPTAQGEQE